MKWTRAFALFILAGSITVGFQNCSQFAPSSVQQSSVDVPAMATELEVALEVYEDELFADEIEEALNSQNSEVVAAVELPPTVPKPAEVLLPDPPAQIDE